MFMDKISLLPQKFGNSILLLGESRSKHAKKYSTNCSKIIPNKITTSIRRIQNKSVALSATELSQIALSAFYSKETTQNAPALRSKFPRFLLINFTNLPNFFEIRVIFGNLGKFEEISEIFGAFLKKGCFHKIPPSSFLFLL